MPSELILLIVVDDEKVLDRRIRFKVNYDQNCWAMHTAKPKNLFVSLQIIS